MPSVAARGGGRPRVEEARRQTQRQLDMIDRQIIRRMTTLIPQLGRKRSGYRRGMPPDPSALLERYRSNLAAITAERQPEIDALSRKLARQDAAIDTLQARCASESGPARDDPECTSRGRMSHPGRLGKQHGTAA
jgi:hypothetical protein